MCEFLQCFIICFHGGLVEGSFFILFEIGPEFRSFRFVTYVYMLDLLRLDDLVLWVVLCYLVEEHTLALHISFEHGISRLPFKCVCLPRSSREFQRLRAILTFFVFILIPLNFLLLVLISR